MGQKGLAFLVATQAVALLGESEFGRYTYVLNLVSLASMLVLLGFPNLLTREIAVSSARNENALLSGIIRFALTIVGAALILSAIFFVLTYHYFFSQSNYYSAWIWPSTLALLVAMVAVGIQQSILRGVNRVIEAAWPVMILQPIIYLLILVAARISHWEIDAPAALMLLAIAYFTASITLQIGIQRNKTLREAITSPPIYQPKIWLRSLGPFFLIGGMAVLMARTDIFILGFFVEDQYIGYYSIATQLAMLILLPLAIINSTIEPKLADAYARNQTAQMRKLFASLSLWSTLAAIASLTSLWFLGEPILRIAFGPEFVTAFTALMILSLGSAVNVALGPLGSFLSMAGYERDTMVGSIMGVALNLILNLVLIPVYGMNGAATATAISVVLMKAAYAWFAYKRLGIPPAPVALASQLLRRSDKVRTL